LPLTGFGHGTRPRFHVRHKKPLAGARFVDGTIVSLDGGWYEIPEGWGTMVEGGFSERLCSFIVDIAFSYTSVIDEAW
jgi:hypothetical protein